MSYVLIVEDETDLAQIVRRVVEDAGLPAKVCHNGVEALELISSPCGPPQLVLTNWVMPRMGGEMLLQHLRNDARLRKVPVVIMSGFPAGKIPKDTLLINKPLRRRYILDLVNRYCKNGCQDKK